MADWARVAQTTIPEYIRQEEVEVLRRRWLFRKLQDMGLIDYNCSGTKMNWKVRFRQYPAQGYRDMQQIVKSRKNRWKTAELDWRAYTGNDAITEFETLKNSGQEAIINVMDDMANNLLEDIETTFCDHFYIDGNATGNTEFLHGLESCLGDAGTYVDGAGTASPAVTPSDTYAGISTVLGNYSGSGVWTGSWPIGRGPAHYDFYSPLIIAGNASYWSGQTKTWENTCEQAMRFGAIYGAKNRNVRGTPNQTVLEGEMYRQASEHIAAKEQVVIQQGQDSSRGTIGVGNGLEFNFEGMSVGTEFGVPADTGYGLNLNHIRLRSLSDRIFIAKPPEFQTDQLAFEYVLRFYGNLRIRSPRCLVKYKRSL